MYLVCRIVCTNVFQFVRKNLKFHVCLEQREVVVFFYWYSSAALFGTIRYFFREKWGYKMINKQAFLFNYRYDFYFYFNSWIWVRAENLHVGITPMLNTSVGNPSGHKYFNVTSISMFLNVRKYVMCRENC